MITGAGQTPEPRFLGSFRPPGASSVPLDLTAHVSDELLLLEIEASEPQRQSAAEALGEVRRCVAELDAAPDLNRLVHVAAREARGLTGFHRVMIYRFLEDGAGSVVAEAKINALTSWLNHHYPESDIPKQARALYLRNAIRVIPDAGYTPAPLCPAANPRTGRPVDMSNCALRSVSPIHLQYLKNMGVAASMSVSIIVDGALWGLISFHHQAPKLVPYVTRELCKHLGQILSQQIKGREDAEHHHESLRLSATREKLLDRVLKGPSLDQALADHIKEVQRAVPADGAAVVVGTQVVRTGHAPGEEQVSDLATWLLASCSPPVYATNRLPGEHSPAESYAADASGLLASVVWRDPHILLLWFRAELVQTINWAGNPHKPLEASSAGQLTPRRSFGIWKETAPPIASVVCGGDRRGTPPRARAVRSRTTTDAHRPKCPSGARYPKRRLCSRRKTFLCRR
jgi:light-regulated signal transduction histidine kinase (bacteriophytochrome)